MSTWLTRDLRIVPCSVCGARLAPYKIGAGKTLVCPSCATEYKVGYSYWHLVFLVTGLSIVAYVFLALTSGVLPAGGGRASGSALVYGVGISGILLASWLGSRLPYRLVPEGFDDKIANIIGCLFPLSLLAFAG